MFKKLVNNHTKITFTVVEDGQAKDQIKLTESGFCYVQQLLQSRLKFL